MSMVSAELVAISSVFEVVTMSELAGWMARERGGGNLRIRPPADVTGPPAFHVIAAAMPNGRRAAPLATAPWTRRSRRTTAAPLRGAARPCQSG